MEEFRKQLIELFNETKLPYEAKYYILKDVYREADDTYRDMLSRKNVAKESEQ